MGNILFKIASGTLLVGATLMNSIPSKTYEIALRGAENASDVSFPSQTTKTPPRGDFGPKKAYSRESVRFIILDEAQKWGVNKKLALFLADAESELVPHAKNPSSTATGLYQIVIGTWEHFECKGERADPRSNAACAMEIIVTNGLRDWTVATGTRQKLEEAGFIEKLSTGLAN